MAGAPGVNPITPALFDFLRELREDNDLYLFVKPSGARSWIQRLVIRGRRRDFGLGSVALVSLAEAREKARANRKLAREGGDPLTERRPRPEHADLRRNRRTGGGAEAVRLAQSEPGPRLDGECAALRLCAHRPDAGLGGDERRCPGHPFPHLAREGLYGPARAQRICTVLEWAVAMEYRTDNPCDRVVSVLGPQDVVVRHVRVLPHREVAAAVRKVRASNAMPGSMLAFEFLVLTAARWGKVRWAGWPEIDLVQSSVDGSRNAHEVQTGALGAPVPPGDRDSGGRTGAGWWSRPVDLHPSGRKAPGLRSAAQTPAPERDRGPAARVPVEFRSWSRACTIIQSVAVGR